MSRRTSQQTNEKQINNITAPAQTVKNLNEKNKQGQVKDNMEKDGQRSQSFSNIIEKGGQSFQPRSQVKPTGNI